MIIGLQGKNIVCFSSSIIITETVKIFEIVLNELNEQLINKSTVEF